MKSLKALVSLSFVTPQELPDAWGKAEPGVPIVVKGVGADGEPKAVYIGEKQASDQALSDRVRRLGVRRLRR